MSDVVWENGNVVSRIWIGDEVVRNLHREITVEDVLEVKAERGFQTIVVLDKISGIALTKEDFPRTGDVIILPVYKAGAFF